MHGREKSMLNNEPLTLYKLIVLYMLNRVNFPMTKSQVGDFILEKEYTNFLTLQQVISELIDSNLIHAETIRNRTHLSITEEGKSTLTFFRNRINPSVKNDIDTFFREHKMDLRNEISVVADYYKSTSGEFEAHLIVKDKGIALINLTMSVPTEEMASAICDNWNQKNQEIYKYLTKELF